MPQSPGAHRFWRINIASNVYDAYGSIAEIAMATATGGVNACTGGTPIESGEYGSGYTASMALDGNPATYWLGGSGFPEWWGYDFGGGNAVAITEVSITARNDGYPSTAPGSWTLDWSDDGWNWTTSEAFTSAPWANGASQTFDVTPSGPAYVAPSPGSHQYWRVSFPDVSAYPKFYALEFRATVGGAPLPMTGLISTPLQAGALANLTDGNPAGCQLINETPFWIGNDFGWNTYQNIAEVAVTGDSSYNFTALTIDWSDNGSAWTMVANFTGLAASGAEQVFDVPGGPPPSGSRRPLAVIMG